VDLVPDTSVLVDGRIHELLDGGKVLVPRAALAELEAQANKGQEKGFAGLDELSKLQQLAKEGKCTIEFVGERPSIAEIQAAADGAIDAMIREVAVEYKARFVTSDRVQAHAAHAQGIDHIYLRPITEETTEIEGLAIWKFFDEETMSIHLKADCIPMGKKGRPGEVIYEPIGDTIQHHEIRALIKECIEFAHRDYESFIELERNGCTVLQVGPMRVTIAQPPFSDGLEVTAVRPVTKTTIDDYDLPDGILERIEDNGRGVFVAGPPGSGKSTFVAAVVQHLHGLNRVIKTMEQPRDLVVPKEVTQYGALDKDMKWTGEIMLLVRPDHVAYDEVRTTNDFTTFADMRLAGIGMFGVTHGSRPIDAIQRLIGRVELGMIPQVVDTVLFIDAGQVAKVLDLEFTVKAPEGMEEDLARPVVLVKDFLTSQPLFELYTFGEQVVVMPLEGIETAPATNLEDVERAVRQFAQGDVEVEIKGRKVVVWAEEWDVPSLIGRGGKTVQLLERRLNAKIDVKSFVEKKGGKWQGHGLGQKEVDVKVKKAGNNVFVVLDAKFAQETVQIAAEGSLIGAGKVSKDGKLRFKLASGEGKALQAAKKAGLDIEATVI
jgi:ATPase